MRKLRHVLGWMEAPDGAARGDAEFDAPPLVGTAFPTAPRAGTRISSRLHASGKSMV